MLEIDLEDFFSPPQASEPERHYVEVQKMLEQWEKEKAETEWEPEKVLLEMKQKVATLQAQPVEE